MFLNLQFAHTPLKDLAIPPMSIVRMLRGSGLQGSLWPTQTTTSALSDREKSKSSPPSPKLKRPRERDPRAGNGSPIDWARLREPRGPVLPPRPRGSSFLPTSSAGPLTPGLLQRPLLPRDPFQARAFRLSGPRWPGGYRPRLSALLSPWGSRPRPAGSPPAEHFPLLAWAVSTRPLSLPRAGDPCSLCPRRQVRG